MLGRMLGAALLNPRVYEEVEHDTGAMWQALLIVVLVSVASGIGGALSGEIDLLRGLIFGVIRGLVSWTMWAAAALLIGVTILKTSETEADWGQVSRGTGFAQTPGLLNILLFIPVVGEEIGFWVFVWQWACMLFALKASLDYNSLWRAFFVVLIALIPVLIINAIIFALLGFGDTDQVEAPQALFRFLSGVIPG